MTISQEQISVQIFWTGGFDSTFRMVQLSRCPVKIQPHYVSNDRKSQNTELASIARITSMLVDHPQTQCEFLPLRIIENKDLPFNDEIDNAFERILKKNSLGIQYVWLGNYALNHPGLELSIHEKDKAMLVINKYGNLVKKTDETTGDYFILDTNETQEDVATLFKYYRFPLATMKKTEMKSIYMDSGYEAVMNSTWFCFNPKNNKPCGYCNPCKYTIEEGLPERFTKMALFRYRCRKFLFPVEQLLISIKRIIKKTIKR